MKFPVAILPGLLAVLAIARAQPIPESNVPKLPDIDARTTAEHFDKNAFVASLRSHFAGIESFGYVIKEGDMNDLRTQAYVLTWKELGDQYHTTMTTNDHVDHDIAYDGKRSSHLSLSGMLWVHNGESEAALPRVFPSPLDVYSFLNFDNTYLSLSRLRPDSPIWKDLANRIDYAGTASFLDHDCIVLRFWGSFNQYMKKKADYDVFFDAKTLVPLGWQAYDNRKDMIEELAAEDLQNLTGRNKRIAFTCPTHCKRTSYQWPGTITGPHGRIEFDKGSFEEAYQDVEVNDLDPADVAIDYTQVKEVFDSDAKTSVRLPGR
jgi:hypothetical protein